MRLSALILCLALLAALLSGCSTAEIPQESLADTTAEPESQAEEPEDAAAAPEETVQTRDSFGIAWQSTAGMHPYTSTSVTNQVIFSLLYEGLFAVDGSFEAEPVLCESCAVSEDGTVWHFDLKQNVTFSDGSAMSAADVVTSLNAARNSAMYQVRFENVTAVEQDGTYGVIVRLSTAYENLPLILDIPIVKASTVSSESPLGSGPYARSGSALIRNRSWWQDATPVVDAERLELVAAESPTEVRDAFEFGGADVAYTDPCASSLSAYHSDSERWGCPTTVMLYVGFNQNGQYCYSSTLRSGVTYAVDRDTIITDIYGGFGLAATLPCSPLSPFYDSALASSYAFNPGSFQACLQSSGIWPDSGNPVKLIVSDTSPKRVQAAQLIAQQMEELGLYTTVTTLGEEDFQYALVSGNFDMYLAEIRLPGNFDLSCFFTYGGSACYGGGNSDSALQLCRLALENSGNYYDLFRTVTSRGLICPVMFKVGSLYATRGVLQDCTPGVSNLLRGGSGVRLADILSETPYDPPAASEDPNGGEPIDLPGEAQEPDPGGEPGGDGETPPDGGEAPAGEAPPAGGEAPETGGETGETG